jgi:molecular chaperone GrpE
MQPESDNENKVNIEDTETLETYNIEELKKALEEERTKCESNLAGWQRAQADFVNFKRFTEQDKLETCKFASTNLIMIILPVLDDFERALTAIPHSETKHKWFEGLKLIDQKFKDILLKQGVEPINSLGQEFDPKFMDAITCGKGRKDIVLMEVEKGYKQYDKVIRPAKVVVGNGEEES